MSTSRTKSRKDRRPRRPSTPEAASLTRVEVAEMLGCSVPTVRRMEGIELRPTKGDDDVHRFVLAEVLRVRRERAAMQGEGSKAGERDARVFDLLDSGKGLREIVTTLRLPVDIVLKLSSQWREVGRRDIVVPPACRAELEQCLGGVNDAAELTRLVRSLEAERERLESENDKMSNRVGGLLSIVGELAARSSDVEQALPELKKELDAERIEMLDRVFKYHQERIAPAIRVAEVTALGRMQEPR